MRYSFFFKPLEPVQAGWIKAEWWANRKLVNLKLEILHKFHLWIQHVVLLERCKSGSARRSPYLDIL